MEEDIIKNEILQGLLQVDSSFIITDFYTNFDKNTRSLSVSFTAQKDDGEEIKVVNNYA